MRRDLLQGIIENPADDVRRLVYADFLEDEGGEIDRLHAQIIRVQILLEQMKERNDAYREGGLIVKEEDQRMYSGLVKRQSQLLACRGVEWIAENAGKEMPFDNASRPQASPDNLLAPWAHFTFHRGFVQEARYTLDDWRRIGPVMAANHPVERVVTQKKPRLRLRSSGAYSWRNGDWKTDDALPRDVFRLLGLPNNRILAIYFFGAGELAALHDLSQALLKLARQSSLQIASR